MRVEDDVAALHWLVEALPYDSATKRARGDQLPTDRLLMDLWVALYGDPHPFDPLKPAESEATPPPLTDRLLAQRERRNRMRREQRG